MAFTTGALAVGSLVSSAAGSAMQASSDSQAAGAQAKAANYQAQVARNNATIAAGNAQAALDEGDVAAQQQYTRGSQVLGSARAAMGANGIQLNSGSALQVQKGIARTTQSNVDNTQYNALTQAISYRNQAQDFVAQSGLDQQEAQDDLDAGKTSALGSIISGASAVSSKWAGYMQNGTFGSSSSAAIPQVGGLY